MRPRRLLGALTVLGALLAGVAGPTGGEARAAVRTTDLRRAASDPSPATARGAGDPEALTRERMGRVAAALREGALLRPHLARDLGELVEEDRLLAGLPADGWDRPLRWRLEVGARRGRLASAGADGRHGTADDLALDVAAP